MIKIKVALTMDEFRFLKKYLKTEIRASIDCPVDSEEDLRVRKNCRKILRSLREWGYEDYA